MATERKPRRSHEPPPALEQATLPPGDWGRVIHADGTEQWWVKSSGGGWIALTHRRVVENDDGTITLLYLK